MTNPSTSSGTSDSGRELKPCPFCGESPIAKYDLESSDFEIVCKNWPVEKDSPCQAIPIITGTKEKVIDLWNEAYCWEEMDGQLLMIATLEKENAKLLREREELIGEFQKLLDYTSNIGGCVFGHEMPEDETFWVPCEKCAYCLSGELLARIKAEGK